MMMMKRTSSCDEKKGLQQLSPAELIDKFMLVLPILQDIKCGKVRLVE